MSDDNTAIVVHGISPADLWRSLVDHLFADADVELETGAGILVRPRRSPQRQIQIVSLRPIEPHTTELLLASGWDNAGFADVFSRKGVTAFIDRSLSKGIDYASRRVIAAGQLIFYASEGPDGDLQIDIDGRTIFCAEAKFDAAGRPHPDNESLRSQFADIEKNALRALADRLGEAAIVLDEHLRETARRHYWTDLERKSRPPVGDDEIPF